VGVNEILRWKGVDLDGRHPMKMVQALEKEGKLDSIKKKTTNL
jgi:hypothetical protein